MKTYTDRATTPLAFHKLLCYVILPISGILYFLSLLNAPRYLEINSLYIGVAIYNLAFFILTLVSMSAITKWNKTVWYALMVLFMGRPICNIGIFCYFGFDFFETSYIIIQIALIISDICISLYYLKRKPLFFGFAKPQINIKNQEELTASVTAATSPTEAEIPNPELSKEPTAENTNSDDESDFYDEFDFFDKYELDSESNKKEEHPLDSVSNITKPKKFFCKENTPLILCIIALLGSLAGNIYQSNIDQALNKELSDLEDDYADAIDNRNHYRTLLYDKIDEYNFYHNNAVIVTENDSYYHTYDCDYVDGSSFWIYNVEAAISQGYKPCPDCNPPQ